MLVTRESARVIYLDLERVTWACLLCNLGRTRKMSFQSINHVCQLSLLLSHILMFREDKTIGLTFRVFAQFGPTMLWFLSFWSSCGTFYVSWTPLPTPNPLASPRVPYPILQKEGLLSAVFVVSRSDPMLSKEFDRNWLRMWCKLTVFRPNTWHWYKIKSRIV